MKLNADLRLCWFNGTFEVISDEDAKNLKMELIEEIKNGKSYEEALKDYNKAISLDEKNPEYRLLRACFYQRTKQKKLSKLDFEKAIELGASPEEIIQLIKTK